ncbi:MAG: TonB-dependent receptor [Draconibacterium sp.]
MKQKLRNGITILLTLLFIGSVQSKAAIFENDDDRPGIIRGQVTEKTSGQPLEFVNVAVYEKQGATLVSGGITNSKGEFEIKGIVTGEFYIEANFIGFEKGRIDGITIDKENRLAELGNVVLSPSTVEIEGVDVVADKSPVEFKLDKKVVNVSQVISAAGGTAVDALENTPSIQVDIEGNVELRGSTNFTVLIDGRPSVLSGTDALRQIPASALQSIEVITNPSAKYEPDGNSGIINLVMKKNSLNGLSGIVNGSVGTGDKYRGDFSLGYRTNKLNFTVGANWRDETNYGSMMSERETLINDTTSYLDLEGSRNFVRTGNTFKSGLELFLSQKSTLAFSGELGKQKNNEEGAGKMHAYTNPVSTGVYSVTDEVSGRKSDFYSGQVSFFHNFNSEGHKLEATAFVSGRKSDDNEQEDEILADETYNPTSDYVGRISTTESENENDVRLQLDYVYPISKSSKLEAGLLSRFESETEAFTFKDFDTSSDSWVTDENFSSTTDFRQDIHAAYSTFSSKWGNLQYMAGLRGEITLREIQNTKFTQSSVLNRFDVFPTLHLSYAIKETNELMTSYSRRISRPNGRDLDPNPAYWNRYTIRLGNPDLKPEYTDSYELGILKRFNGNYVSLDGFHRVTHNKIERLDSIGTDGIFYSSPDNIGKDFSTGVEVTGNLNVTKWLLLNASVSVYNYRIKGELNSGEIDRESTNWNGRLNTTFKIADNSRLQINSFYRSPSVSVQGESKAMFFSNISYRQEFLKKKLTATVSVQDPLGTARFERLSYGDNFKSWFKFEREPQVVMLTLSYKLNNFKEDRRGGNSEAGGSGMDMGGAEF